MILIICFDHICVYHIKMNTTVRYMRMALLAVIVIVVMAAISAVLEIGIINAGQAQEQEQLLSVSLLVPFFCSTSTAAIITVHT